MVKEEPFISVDSDGLLCELGGRVFVFNTLPGSIIEKTRLITCRKNATSTITVYLEKRRNYGLGCSDSSKRSMGAYWVHSWRIRHGCGNNIVESERTWMRQQY